MKRPIYFSDLNIKLPPTVLYMQVALEGIEDKYKINLSRDCKLLKNKKFMGTLPEQNVRTSKKPQIQEVRQLMEELKLKDGKKQIDEVQKIKEISGMPQCERF